MLKAAGCWFTSDLTRLLVNFIPRWLIIISILAIYIRLYFVIYKAHRGTVCDEEVSVIMNVMPLGSRTPDLLVERPKGDAVSNSGTTISSDLTPQPKMRIRGDAKALKKVTPSSNTAPSH